MLVSKLGVDKMGKVSTDTANEYERLAHELNQQPLPHKKKQ